MMKQSRQAVESKGSLRCGTRIFPSWTNSPGRGGFKAQEQKRRKKAVKLLKKRWEVKEVVKTLK
jgi:hypothetical protein